MLLIEKMKRGDGFTDNQKLIIDYMLDKIQEIETMTLKELAEKTYTSPASFVRVAKKMGYDGFEQFKAAFLEEQKYLNTHFQKIDCNLPFGPHDNYITIANRIAVLEKETIDDTLSLINLKSLKAAVNVMKMAEAIHISAISYPLLYARDFQLKMRRIGKRVEITEVVGEQLYTAPIIGKNDCAVIISYSGETPLNIDMMKLFKRKEIPIIAITSLGDNTVRKNADIVLDMTTREKLYSKIAGYTNEVSIKLLLDILYSCYFSSEYHQFLSYKKSLSKNSEPGRYSNTDILKE